MLIYSVMVDTSDIESFNLFVIAQVIRVERNARVPQSPRPLPAAGAVTLRLPGLQDGDCCVWAAMMAAVLHPPNK